MASEKHQIRQRESIDIRSPRNFAVIFHNDDFTTMDFVVKVLRQVFFMSEEQAVAVMLDIHKSGSAAVGVYSYDVAASKKKKATALAREENFPLIISVQPA